jgi:hypothetical protein
MFSGGLGSYEAARRVIERHGEERVTLLFADTKMEDYDLYRFVGETAFSLNVEIFTIADGRDVWQVFRDERYLGNSRIDPCSKILKRKLMRQWVEDKYEPGEVTVYLGIDWTEEHRFTRARDRWAPYQVEAPLCDPPPITKAEIVAGLLARFIEPPRLYAMGFPHNNCGGFCVKAGQAQFRLLLEKMPERYAYHEAQEEQLRYSLGKDVSILKDRRGGITKPLTLRAFRERVQGGQKTDQHEWGGCGCAVD